MSFFSLPGTVARMGYLQQSITFFSHYGIEPTALFPPLLLALWWFWWRWYRDRASWQTAGIKAEMLSHVMAVSPDGWYLWSASDDPVKDGDLLGGGQCSRRLAVMLSLFSGHSASFGDVVSVFLPGDGARLSSLVYRLRSEGEGFSVILGLQPAEGQEDVLRRVEVSGVRALADDGRCLADVLWARDVSSGEEDRRELVARFHCAAREASRLQRILDTIPLPVWVRDDGLDIILVNRTFLDAVDSLPGQSGSSVQELVAGSAARDLRAMASAVRASGRARSGTWHTVVGGSRRLMEITESPVIPGQGSDDGLHTVGVAQDITRLEVLRQATEQQMGSHVAVLERLGTAVAIFGSDTRLRFHNPAFARLWKLDPLWLATSNPDYAEVLEQQRLNRLLPEVADYPAFRQRELARFKALLEPMEDLLHLPDGKTLRRVLAPHPLGGLLATYEDVTDRLTLEARLRQVLAVQDQIMDALPQAVAVFDADGHLCQANTAFRTLWKVDAETLERHPAFAMILARQPDVIQADPIWTAVQTFLSAPPGDRGVFPSPSGSLSAGVMVIALPDGCVLLVQPDVTERASLPITANPAYVLSSLAELIRAPLGTVGSLCEVLFTGDMGGLDPSRQEYAGRVMAILHFLSVINDAALDLDWLQEQSEDPVSGAVSLRELMSVAMADVQAAATHRDIVFDYRYDASCDRVSADGSSLRQSLVLVFASALAAAYNHGRIRLEVRDEPVVSLSGAVLPGVVVTVSDDGAVPGYDVCSAVLALAKSGIRRNGGRLSVFSFSGRGTRVQIRLPALVSGDVSAAVAFKTHEVLTREA
ncbi:PAS domain-containing protein [Haematospirillum jordaniae]|uniref:PAS domain-containing protein n=1 Tax=Haematospirillum jordaniae TaxID=1549855 RepID=UPI001432F717|nr:PAS domain-containing protein [Haematospirillum jordaniae]NKD84217.1 PAS domain-containing protein [Haematospirillum jordaniae]